MKLVREHINEKFTQDSDPIKDLNIGIKTQILNDLEKIGITETDIKFNMSDYTFFMKSGRRNEPTTFYDIQLKYFPEAKVKLLKSLKDTNKDIKKIIDDAVKDGIDKDEILFIVKYMLSYLDWNDKRYHTADYDKKQAEIYIHKLKRSNKQRKKEENDNIYVFIGFVDKVPITVNGKQYYEDKFDTETLLKIDKYDVDQLQQISMMKLRATVQYGGKDSGVYMVTMPKDLMDKDRYTKIPEHLYDIVVKYKQRI